MARTDATKVKAVLGANYGKLPDGSNPDLQQYIDTATDFVDQVSACSSRRNRGLGATTLELIERWMAAHFYTRMDPTYTSRSTAGASGSFTAPKDDPERYRKTAIEIDTSGCVNALLNRLTAGVQWLGKNPSDQIDYKDRR